MWKRKVKQRTAYRSLRSLWSSNSCHSTIVVLLPLVGFFYCKFLNERNLILAVPLPLAGKYNFEFSENERSMVTKKTKLTDPNYKYIYKLKEK